DMDAERVENALDNEWRGLEEEEKAAELGHHQRMNRFQQQLEELGKQETELIEKLPATSECGVKCIEPFVASLSKKNEQLKSLSEARLQHMRAELREREAFL
ncbi:hypothetical protein TcCL_ESM11873, partial [Trypanosoma cruzi]